MHEGMIRYNIPATRWEGVMSIYGERSQECTHIESFLVNRSNLLKVHARTDPDLPSLVIFYVSCENFFWDMFLMSSIRFDSEKFRFYVALV